MSIQERKRASGLKFRKMHGIGNDFVVLDGVRSALPEADFEELSRQVCDRRFGVGSDGLIAIDRASSGSAEFRMRMWNPDGSESEMCGNGIRCVARYLVDEGIVAPADGLKIPVDTGAGLLVLEPLADGRVRVDMGVAGLTRGVIGMSGPAEERFLGQSVETRSGEVFSGTAVSMGNPHLVVLLGEGESRESSVVGHGRQGEGVWGIDLETLGPELEHSQLFPSRTNVHFVEVLDQGHIVQRTWERGAGVTLACGTGACACAVASFLNGLTGRRVLVDLPGGQLEIEYAEDGHVFMTGPAETVFDGVWGE